MFSFKKKLVLFLAIGLIISAIPSLSLAFWSQDTTFFVESDYDLSSRTQIDAQLIKTTNKIYFYVDKDWYNGFSQKIELGSKIYNLSSNFEYKIYPFLTNLLGFEDNPGVDNDSRIIVVLEPLKQSYGGYIQTGDQYFENQYSRSNQGQIIYLNANLIVQSPLDFLSYELAHEFTHLITLNQKSEADTWFHELMSEFAGQAIGVDTSQVTKKRAQSLLYSTEINLKDWKNSDKDYGKVYLLGLYLKEQFGNQIFANTLKYPSKDGIVSFNGAFKQLGINGNLDDIYLNWLIANLVNNCQNSSQYCYEDLALKDYSAIAYSYYLPTQVESTLSVTDSISAWTGKWQKITGGSGSVKLKFTIPENTPISKIPYIIEDNQGKKTLGFLDFTGTNIQEIYVNDMGSKNTAVYFIPFIGSAGEENKLYYYSFEVQNLGKCLQQFLTNLGTQIYPEALITGYFGPLTQAAVKRYQAWQGIITTGYFGPLTRAAVNNKL